MFRRSVRLLAPVAVKETTGITGLEVVPNAREVLTALYRKTLSDLEVIPEDVFYRRVIEGVTKYRLRVVQELESIEDIEDEIGCGQVEELIEQAKDELELIPRYASWRLYEESPPEPEDDGYEDLYEGLQEMSEAELRRAGAHFGFAELGDNDPRASSEAVEAHIERLRAAKEKESERN